MDEHGNRFKEGRLFFSLSFYLSLSVSLRLPNVFIFLLFLLRRSNIRKTSTYIETPREKGRRVKNRRGLPSTRNSETINASEPAATSPISSSTASSSFTSSPSSFLSFSILTRFLHLSTKNEKEEKSRALSFLILISLLPCATLHFAVSSLMRKSNCTTGG